MSRRDNAKRIRRLKNRIKRTRSRLSACEAAKQDPRRRNTLRDLARLCDGPGRDFDDVVDDVAQRLDDWIEPRNPVWEWVSDIGIDIAAHVAVTIWRDTEARLRRRLDRLERDLARLEAR